VVGGYDEAMDENPYKPPTEVDLPLTDRARYVLSLAAAEAKRLQHACVSTEHVLLGLLREGTGVGCLLLRALDMDLDKLRFQSETLSTCGASLISTGKLVQTPAVKLVIDRACSEALDMGHRHVGTEHLLLALLTESGGTAAYSLMIAGVNRDRVSKQLRRVLGEKC
jgi:ATP-dependent Clp protease ATP-binding subunit ClpC